jgi:hypothetical protein
MERLGVSYLRRLASRGRAAGAEDAVHILNDQERAALRSIERWAIARAALAGALSGLVGASPALLLAPPAPGAPAAALAGYWLPVGGVIVAASAAEIAFLYWDALRAVQALAHAAGLDLGDGLDDDPSGTLRALARAALEIPNPPDVVPGIDPMRGASRWRVVLWSLAYKLKVALSGFLLKALVRRVLGRAATRAVIELVAVPVTAAWDAIVCWIILREARLRVMGPSAALELTGMLFPGETSPALAECALRAVGSAVVCTRDLHPNLVALLRAIQRAVGQGLPPEMDDARRFLASLAALPPAEQTAALRTLAAASIIDGHLAPAEIELLGEAFQVCGRPLDVGAVEALRRALVSGRAIPPARIEDLARDATT